MKAFIFDMDGVLIDSEPLHIEMEQQILRDMGVEISKESMSRFIGTTNSYMWNTLIDEFMIEKTYDEIVEYSLQVKQHFFETHPIEPIGGIVDLLEQLKLQGIKLAVASSSPESHIHIITERLGIKDYFDLLVSGENVENSKPAPDVFLHTAKLLNVEPKDCYVIEDSTHGVAAAKNAGMYCIGYDNPNSLNQVYDQADEVITSIRQLLNR